MCGLFGFAGQYPDPEIIERIAVLAQTRGPHAWGYTTIADGKFITQRGTGLVEKPEILGEIKSISGSFIGLCRLATSGTWRDPKNNQPIVYPGVAMVHNGNVYNRRELFDLADKQPETNCDSESILALYTHLGSEPDLTKLEYVVDKVDLQSPLAVMMLMDRGVLVIRRDHPLFFLRADEGVYFCSRRFDDGTKQFSKTNIIPNVSAYLFPNIPENKTV